MKRAAFFFTAVASLLLLPAVSQAGKDSDELRQFGLVGSWSFDCAKTPSPANPFISFVPSTAGQPSRQVITGKPQYDSLVPMTDVKMLDATHLRLTYPQGGVTVTVTLLKGRRRIRPYEAVASDGTVSVSGGVVKANGLPTGWLLKCAD
jgi:hypothetical protein